jgi:hypothetical protein
VLSKSRLDSLQPFIEFSREFNLASLGALDASARLGDENMKRVVLAVIVLASAFGGAAGARIGPRGLQG